VPAVNGHELRLGHRCVVEAGEPAHPEVAAADAAQWTAPARDVTLVPPD